MKEKNYNAPEVEVEQINDTDIVATSTGWAPEKPLNPVSSGKSSISSLLGDD